jgi:hypothetical protein
MRLLLSNNTSSVIKTKQSAAGSKKRSKETMFKEITTNDGNKMLVNFNHISLIREMFERDVDEFPNCRSVLVFQDGSTVGVRERYEFLAGHNYE